MARKRRATTAARSCTGKRGAYPDAAKAREHIALSVQRGGWNGDLFTPYPCRHCGKWHIGHDPDAIRKIRRR